MGLLVEDARDLAVGLADALKRRGHDAYESVSTIARDVDVAEQWKSPWPKIVLAGALGFIAGLAINPTRKAATHAVSGMSGDWFSILIGEHRRLDRLITAACATKDNEVDKRTAVLAKIAAAVARISLQETGAILPALRDLDQGAASKELAAEHFEMKTYLHELDRMAKDDPRWLGKLKAFRKLVKEHVRQEEEHVFPELKTSLSPEENARLTRDMLREAARLS